MQHRTAVGLARQLEPPVAVFAVSRVVVGLALAIALVVAPGYDRSDFFLDWDAAPEGGSRHGCRCPRPRSHA